MIFLELINGFLLVLLALLATWRDCKDGIIPNRLLGIFALAGCIIDIFYYGIFVPDIFLISLMNFLLVSAIGVYLFYSHSFAGGDCKMLCVMSLLYPGRFLLTYGNTRLTLAFALGIGIIWGYIYLLIDSVVMLIKGKNKISWVYVRKSVTQFLISFASASVYISAVNLILQTAFISNPSFVRWPSYLFCVGIAWCTGRFRIMQKWFLILPVFLADCLFGKIFHIIPFSVHPENYILIIILLFCRMTISTNIYEQISIQNLKPGMILSTFSSAIMQGSKIKGMPAISTEDLSSRLSQTEVESINHWANSRNAEFVSVVKKIPFALFIAMGYITYFLLWSFIQ